MSAVILRRIMRYSFGITDSTRHLRIQKLAIDKAI
jgi:hypothetical protein